MIPLVLGLDLSCESTGAALPDGTTTTITAPKQAGKKRTLADDLDRLHHIDRAVRAIFDGHADEVGRPPDVVAIEDYAPGIRSASAHRLAEVGGVVRLACRDYGIPIALIGTMQLKQYATGKGRADKGELRIEAYKRVGLEFPNDDECDAWWLRAMALDFYDAGVVAVPKSHAVVLHKIAWPTLALDLPEVA